MLWGRLRHVIPQRRAEGKQDAPSTLNSFHFKEEHLFDKLFLEYSKQWSRLDFISHASLTWLLMVLILSCYKPPLWGQNRWLSSRARQCNLTTSVALHRPQTGWCAPSGASPEPRISFSHCLYFTVLGCFIVYTVINVGSLEYFAV